MNTATSIQFPVAVCLVLLSLSAQSVPTVESYTLTAKSRVSRFEFEYEYRVRVHNPDGDIANLVGVLTSVSPNTVVVDGSAGFGDVLSGAFADSTDTVRIRQDRRFAASLTDLSWNFISEPAPPQTLSQLVSSADGGTLTVQNFRGDTVVLKIPPNALPLNTTVSLTALAAAPASPVANTAFPGVDIGPDGLVLNLPARLTVTLANPGPDPLALSALYPITPRNIFLPLGGRVTVPGRTSGDIRHFSAYMEGVPTADEIGLALLQIKHGDIAAGPILQKVLDIIDSFYAFNVFASMDETVGQTTPSDAQGFLEEQALAFLGEPVPASPCGDYHKATYLLFSVINKFLPDSISSVRQEYLNRMKQLEFDRGCTDLTGTWTIVPQRAQEKCAHGPDRWTESDVFPTHDAVLTQAGNTVTETIPLLPSAAPVHGTLDVTGDIVQPVSVEFKSTGSGSPDCTIFMESNATDIIFGDIACAASANVSRAASYCWEDTRSNGVISADGQIFLGFDFWDFEAGYVATTSLGKVPVGFECAGSESVSATKK